MSDEEDISSVSYALRIHPRANADTNAEKTRYEELSGQQVATDWATALYDAIAKLSYTVNKWLS